MNTFKSCLELLRRTGPVWRGVYDSVALRLKDGVCPEFTIKYDHPLSGTFVQRAFRNNNVTGIMEIFLQSHVWCEGARSFRPTEEQCRALEQMEPRLSAAEYHQPYPTMAVELPERYRLSLRQEVETMDGGTVMSNPCWIVVHHAPSIPALVCASYWDDGHVIARTLHHYDGMPTIADLFARASKLPPGSLNISTDEDEASIKVLRVAINALMLLTHYGCRTEPENPSHYARLQRYVEKAKKRGDSRSAEEELRQALFVCDFEQKVKLYDTHTATRGDGTATGRVVGSHWRRGHMRRQPYGEKNTLRKLIFIKPVLIHADAAVAPQTVVYEARS